VDLKDAESNAKLTEHLRSQDFFGVDQFGYAVLAIRDAQQDGETYMFKGELTIKDATRGVEGFYDVVMKDGRPLLVGSLSFDRTEYGIRFRSGKFFDDLGDKMISDDVMIGFEMEI